MADSNFQLTKYTSAHKQMMDHQKNNSSVFDEHKRLMMLVIDAENELRDAVAENKANVSNNDFKVTVTPQTQTFADIDVIDRLIANGQISASLRESIVKTVPRPERITISATNI